MRAYAFAFVFALAGCLDARAPAQAESPDPEDGIPLPIETLARTAESGVKDKRLVVVTDSRAWTHLWAEHAWNRTMDGEGRFVNPPPPDVDFSRENVVAAFLGSRPTGGHAIEVRSAAVGSDAVRVEVVSASPGERCFVTQAFTAPAHIAKIPAVSVPVRFTEGATVNACE